MPVSVILIAYHGDPWLPACLESLARASRERLHLVLVDNDGNRSLESLDLHAFDAEILRCPRPLGFAEANNFALVGATSLANHVLFLNQDTLSEPLWIDPCVERLASDNRVAAVSPFIRTYDDLSWDPSFVSCLEMPNMNPSVLSDATGAFIETSTVPAPALLMKTKVLNEVGPFDPVFGSYYEDYDLCRRVRAAGYRVGFCSQATIRHYSGSSTTSPEKELKRMRQILRNRTIHRLRSVQGNRLAVFSTYLVIDVPRRIVRGLLRRPGAHPPSVTISAAVDLMGLAPRIINRQRDEEEWQTYLRDLGWHDRARTRRQTSLA